MNTLKFAPVPKLSNLTKILQFYKPHANSEEEQKADVVNGCSIGSVAHFVPKRAAVLICLFEDESGQIRVILTKRSANLSTHSGHVYLFI